MALAGVPCITTAILVWALTIAACRCCDSEAKRSKPPCPTFRKKDKHSEDLLLHPTNDHISKESLDKMRQASRVCLPCPGRNIEAYSGFIPVDSGEDESYSSYLFFLHIKSEKNANKKPLLLWLQGGPGKSALYGQFLENGPLGMTVLGTLYKRRHTLLKQFNIIYLDQPVGAGYSFDRHEKYPSSLEEVSVHLMRFMRRFLRIFHEYKGRDFYVAGESYGARSAVGMASRVLTRTPEELPLRFMGVMLGVPFLFPLLQIINSADFLYCSGLLDNGGRELFSGRFSMIQKLVASKQCLNAAGLLSKTVFNLGFEGEQTLFSNLTGFLDHASIISPQKRREVVAYYVYANRWDFKQRIHVNTSRILDGTRLDLAKQLTLNDFFEDQREIFEGVLNRTAVLFYTAQLDALFPAVKIYESFRMLQWRGSEMFKEAQRVPWYRNNKPSLGLLGYLKKVDRLMYATVLFGGHRISLDCTAAVKELYDHFLKFVKSRNESPPISQQKV
ncbi:probable serine carboxypeptidase CPVL isoform X2 [Rhipicephalus sanguineus]|uniref:probable serine carboxypeptidase CPVL isoform X2 n=1 Tax=Rhipicephalus sanguineus TaxID=34632 RepID=UPI0020C2D2FE|nr:probable serine carboxypeptidase CPVL isoform X2 [Rhipicephalus sanguineus]